MPPNTYDCDGAYYFNGHVEMAAVGRGMSSADPQYLGASALNIANSATITEWWIGACLRVDCDHQWVSVSRVVHSGVGGYILNPWENNGAFSLDTDSPADRTSPFGRGACL